MKSLPDFFLNLLLCGAAGAFTLGEVHAVPTFENREQLLQFIESKRNFTFDIDQDQNSFPDSWFMENGPTFHHSTRITNQGDKDENA